MTTKFEHELWKQGMQHEAQERQEREQPCAHNAMDKWELENLAPKDRGKPRMLCCTCPKCSPVCM